MAPKRKRMKLQKPVIPKEVESEFEPFRYDAQQAHSKSKTKPVEEQLAEPKPKKKKTSILSLNDDCLDTILRKLSLSDLCAVSETCKRLKILASQHFMRYHKSKVMTIQDVDKDEKLVLRHKDEEYIRCFEKCIQNVTFDKSLALKATLRSVNKVYHSKQTEQMAPIKTLRIDGWGRGIRMSHRPALANLVANVESITVANTKVHGDLNECLLKHMPNMKRLTIWQTFDEEPGDVEIGWMQQTYPNLEYFAWHADSEVPIAQLKQLLDCNPSIRFISLYTKSRVTLARLLDWGIQIDELYFDFTGANIPVIFNDLRLLCEEQFCKRLHLKFADTARQMLTRHLNQLVAFGPYIEGLYFEKIAIDNNFARIIMTFDQLKVLQLNISQSASLLSKLVSLEEIFVYWGVDRTNFKSYGSALLTYAETTPTLKKIYMRNNSQPFERFEFDELDSARKELDGANKLKIYFKTEELDFTGKLNAIKCDYDMVEILRVETEHVANPLVTEYLTTKKLNTSPYLDYVYGQSSYY